MCSISAEEALNETEGNQNKDGEDAEKKTDETEESANTGEEKAPGAKKVRLLILI